MKPLPHLYEVALSGGPKGYATLLAGGAPALRSAPPKDFDGPGDAWSPEHLLLAAVETCFMLTFRAVAQASKFDFLSLELSAAERSTARTGPPASQRSFSGRGSDFQRVRTQTAQNGCSRWAKRLAS